MHCSKCGASNDDNASECGECGASLSGAGEAQGVVEQIPNYLVHATLTTIFCCLPFGIVAIVFAAQVNGKISAGDITGARQSSANAKTWCWVAFGLGLLVAILSLAFGALGALFGARMPQSPPF